MKTTVEIEDRLLRQAKKVAVDRRTTLRRLIEAGLRDQVRRQPSAQGIQWVTASGHFPEGLDLANRDAMYDWLERQDEAENPD